MTINSFLQVFETMDHQSTARYPDGSGGRDEYILTVFVNGHGKLLNAKVKQVRANRGTLYVWAEGQK